MMLLDVIQSHRTMHLPVMTSRWQMEYKCLCADGTYKIVLDQAYIIRDKDQKSRTYDRIHAGCNRRT